MKAILEFNLDDIDQSTQHELALAGPKLAYILSEFINESLRRRIKYDNTLTEKEIELVSQIRQELVTLINDENVGELV